MIVIADSGSTKTDWCLGNTKTNSRTVRTGGITPFHQSVDEIKEVIASTLIPQLGDTTEFTTIYFYGAGCIPEKTNIVKTALAQNFPKANILWCPRRVAANGRIRSRSRRQGPRSRSGRPSPLGSVVRTRCSPCR